MRNCKNIVFWQLIEWPGKYINRVIERTPGRSILIPFSLFKEKDPKMRPCNFPTFLLKRLLKGTISWAPTFKTALKRTKEEAPGVKSILQTSLVLVWRLRDLAWSTVFWLAQRACSLVQALAEMGKCKIREQHVALLADTSLQIKHGIAHGSHCMHNSPAVISSRIKLSQGSPHLVDNLSVQYSQTGFLKCCSMPLRNSWSTFSRPQNMKSFWWKSAKQQKMRR